MTTTLLGAGLCLAFAVLGWVAYRFSSMKKNLKNYSAALRQASEQETPPASLPLDVPHLEDLSNAVHDLSHKLHEQNLVLNDERERLAAVLDQITDGVLLVDPRGIIQFANPAAEKLFEHQTRRFYQPRSRSPPPPPTPPPRPRARLPLRRDPCARSAVA